MIVGVISDTHGLLRSEVSQVLSDCELIIHAGDVGGPAVLEELGRIAPVHAVQGNMDGGAWARSLPPADFVQAGECNFYVLHDLLFLDLDPTAAGVDVVVSGHTHMPHVYRKDGVLYLNPGSAGPYRTGKPISLARVTIDGRRITPEIIELSG